MTTIVHPADSIETLQGLYTLNNVVCGSSLSSMVIYVHLPSPQWSCPLDIIEDDIGFRVARVVPPGLKSRVKGKSDILFLGHTFFRIYLNCCVR